MHKILYAPASPYSAKVRMAAAYASIPLEAVKTDTAAAPPELLQANPLGKNSGPAHRRWRHSLRQPRDHAVSEQGKWQPSLPAQPG